MLRFRFQTPLIMRTGYGKLGCWLARCFLGRTDTSVDITPHQAKLYDDVPRDIVDATGIDHGYRKLGLMLSYAHHLNLLPTERKSIYTMWETTRLPHEFIVRMKNADLMFSPSEFCTSLFEAEVQGLRVETVGCGVDTNFYRMSDRENTGPLTIGTAGVMSPRKGIDVLLAAWNAIADKPDVRLLVKTRDTRWLPKKMPDNAEVVDDEFNEQDMREFYRSLDYFVLPTRGEGFCTLPDTKIVTRTGREPILDLRVGDFVYTHAGNYKEVTSVFSRNYDGDMIGIRPHYSRNVDWYTPEHPIRTMRFTSKEKRLRTFENGEYVLGWTDAGSLDKDEHYVVVPRFRSSSTTTAIDFIEFMSEDGMMVDNGYIVSEGRNQYGSTGFPHPASARILPHCMLSHDVMRLFGLYIAEGCSNRSTLKFSFNTKETELYGFVIDTMRGMWGIEGVIEHYDRNRTTVTFYCGPLAVLFANMFGKGAASKRIPEVLFSSERAERIGLLRGLFEGDGSISAGEYSYSTVSDELAEGVKKLLYTLDVISVVYIRSKKHCRNNIIADGVYHCLDEYKVRCKGPRADNLFAEAEMHRDTSSYSKTYNRYFMDDDNFYIRIREIESCRYDGMVYNIGVADDESYCGQFAVHNCMPPIEAACCGTPGFVTNWSGPREYIGDYIRPINWKSLSTPPVGAFSRDNVGKWAEPSVDHLASLFCGMYNDGRPSMERRESVSRWARGNYSILNVSDRIIAGLRRLNP